MEKLIRLQLARTGVFGADGREITEKDLEDVQATFDGKCPVSLGHYAARQDWMPSWGNVENIMLERQGEGGSTVLIGDMRISDVLWDAIQAGFYPGWSVSIPTGPDGRHYLHHVAFLGAVPPAIRDLKILQTSDGEMPEGAVRTDVGFAAGDTAQYSYADFGDDGRPREIVDGGEPDGEDDGDDGSSGADPQKDGDAGDGHADGGDGFADRTEADAVVEKARKVFANSVRSSLDAALDGVVPAGMKDKVHEFADLAMERWDFSDEDEEPRLITLFKEIVRSIGKMPATGRMKGFSDSDGAGSVERTDPAMLAARF